MEDLVIFLAVLIIFCVVLLFYKNIWKFIKKIGSKFLEYILIIFLLLIFLGVIVYQIFLLIRLFFEGLIDEIKRKNIVLNFFKTTALGLSMLKSGIEQKEIEEEPPE